MLLKVGACQICPSDKAPQPLIKGLCQLHYWTKARRRTAQKQDVQRMVLQPSLRQWYLDAVEQSSWICENCEAPIPAFSEEARFSAQAHILPKSIFSSVATHPMNRLHLGNQYGCGCHNLYDLSFHHAGSMPVFSLALERFTLFAPAIHHSEVAHLPETFQPHYNQPNYGRL